MIDLTEPVKKTLSSGEARLVRHKFLVLLHSLLLFYLILHNLIIPLVINLFKGQDILSDVHYWFFSQIPVHLWLRQKKKVYLSYVLFLIFGSLTRLLYCSLMYVKSWSLVSVYLSELSSLIFIFIIWQDLVKDRYVFFSVLGVFITPILTSLEFSPPQKANLSEKREKTFADYSSLGCKGSRIKVTFPVTAVSSDSGVDITACGMKNNLLIYNREFVIRNKTNQSFNLRLYELKKGSERYSWKFIRIIRIEQNSSEDISKFFRKPSMYLLKSPEYRDLGMLAMIPIDSQLKGTFELTPETLTWRNQ